MRVGINYFVLYRCGSLLVFNFLNDCCIHVYRFFTAICWDSRRCIMGIILGLEGGTEMIVGMRRDFLGECWT